MTNTSLLTSRHDTWCSDALSIMRCMPMLHNGLQLVYEVYTHDSGDYHAQEYFPLAC